MGQGDIEDGRTGQPFRPGGNLNDWIIGDAQRKVNQHIADSNSASSPFGASSSYDPFAPPPPPPPVWTPTPDASGYDSGPIFQRSEPATGADAAGCVLGFGALILGPVLWPLLYPLSTVAALAVTAGMELLIYLYVPIRQGSPLILLYLLPIVLFLPVLFRASRLDHRLARYLVYRIPRHLLRLALVGTATFFLAGSTPLWQRPGMSVLQFVREGAADRSRLGATIAAVVVMHVLLCHIPRLRAGWHEAMERIGLRSA